MIRLKLFFILTFLFASTLSYAQIDYKALVRNLEDVTKETNLKEYFEGLPNTLAINENSGKYKDERFLRLYKVIVDDVEFENSWSGRYVNVTLFDEEADYKFFKEKFTSLLGEPEIDDSSENELYYKWSSDKKRVTMSVKLEEGKFLEFEEDLSIKFLEE